MEFREEGGVDKGEDCALEKGRFVGVMDCFGDTLGGVACTSDLDFGVVGRGGVE